MSHVSRGKSPATWGSSSAQMQSHAGCTLKDKTMIGTTEVKEWEKLGAHKLKYVHYEDVVIATTSYIQAGFTAWVH